MLPTVLRCLCQSSFLILGTGTFSARVPGGYPWHTASRAESINSFHPHRSGVNRFNWLQRYSNADVVLLTAKGPILVFAAQASTSSVLSATGLHGVELTSLMINKWASQATIHNMPCVIALSRYIRGGTAFALSLRFQRTQRTLRL